jgi:hypothetical protein
MTREWVTLSEAAEWAQKRFESAGRSLSRKTVSRWALDGKVRAVQQGKRWFVQPASLVSFVTEQLNDESDVPAPVVESDSVTENLESAQVSEPVRHPASHTTPSSPSEPVPDRVRQTVQRRNAQFLRDLNNGID